MIRAIGLFLLMLLKILGWALLILLLFLLAVLLLVLFVPVRYDVRMQNERSIQPGQKGMPAGLHVRLKVSWLLHLLHISVSYGPEGLQQQIRVAGIDVPKVLTKLTDRKRKKQEQREAKKNRQLEQKSEQLAAGEPEQTGPVNRPEPELADKPRQTEPAQKPEPADRPGQTEPAQKPELTDKPGQTGPAPKQEKGSYSVNAGVSELHTDKRSKTVVGSSEPGLFTRIRAQLSRLHKEFTDEVNRQAVGHLWRELLRLLRNYKPRKLKADLSFSLADPALTGAAVGIISLMPWIYRYPCSIIPDFTSDRLYIEGEIEVRGKAALYVLMFSLLRLLRDKQFMRVVRRLMKRDGS